MTTGQPNKFTCVIDFSEQHTQCRSFLEKKRKEVKIFYKINTEPAPLEFDTFVKKNK